MRVLWLGIGTAEPKRMYDSVKSYHEALKKAGIKHVYYESPGTSHEWLTWRRCLHEFAPLLFVNASTAGRPGRPQRRPIVLNPDDVPAFPDPPAGFDKERADVPHGRLEMIYLRIQVGRHDPQDAGVYAAGLLPRKEVSGALSVARHRRRRDGMAAVRQTQRSAR